jgi:biotin transport system permease protein
MANIGIRPAYQAVAPVLWLIALLFLTHLWLDGVEVASFSVARLLILVLAASLVTITTRSSEFVDGIVAALRRGPAWLPAEKIALAISLTLRLLPSISITLAEIRIAQRARFLDGDIKALLVPLIVRTLKQSDNLAEAIHARSG